MSQTQKSQQLKQSQEYNKQQKQQTNKKSHKLQKQYRKTVLTRFKVPVMYQSIYAYTSKLKINLCSINHIKTQNFVLFAYKNVQAQVYPFQKIYQSSFKGNLKQYVEQLKSKNDKISCIDSQIQNIKCITIVLPEFFVKDQSINVNISNQQKPEKEGQQKIGQGQKQQQEQNKNDKTISVKFTYELVFDILNQTLEVLNYFGQKKIIFSYMARQPSDELSDFMIRALLQILENKQFLNINKVAQQFNVQSISILTADNRIFSSLRRAFRTNALNNDQL